jgi:hypothetical protein
MSILPSGVAIIVDIENIKISAALEAEIVKIFPGEEIIKIAVGNWKLLKSDIELRARGYHLFHVPTGRDHADREIINLGWLLKSYTKLVVVSNDKIFFKFAHQFNSCIQKVYLVYHSQAQAGFVTVNPQILLYDNPERVSKQSAKEELIISIRKLIQTCPQLATDSAKMGQEFKKLYGVSISAKMKQAGILGSCSKFITQILKSHN